MAKLSFGEIREASIDEVLDMIPEPPTRGMRTIRTNALRVGMITMIRVNGQWRRDGKLKEHIPARGCLGLHFLTDDKTNVCYLPGGLVTVVG